MTVFWLAKHCRFEHAYVIIASCQPEKRAESIQAHQRGARLPGEPLSCGARDEWRLTASSCVAPTARMGRSRKQRLFTVLELMAVNMTLRNRRHDAAVRIRRLAQ